MQLFGKGTFNDRVLITSCFLSPGMLATGSSTGGLRFQELNYTIIYWSNLKSASNDLQFDVHLVHRITRPMVKQVRNLCVYSRPGDRVWQTLNYSLL